MMDTTPTSFCPHTALAMIHRPPPRHYTERLYRMQGLGAYFYRPQASLPMSEHGQVGSVWDVETTFLLSRSGKLENEEDTIEKCLGRFVRLGCPYSVFAC